ncbi:helix-turn-helix transcriptional regulator [Sphingomonas bacterium]|uniref:helix-turn-helix transcriptional regulator n=1 Tax=Sphingomonas bacterium TaxID=1895847 RepID=UPI0015771228|nr:helix-turn-helix transcriptional regulator [Sphingomonas bacterium]
MPAAFIGPGKDTTPSETDAAIMAAQYGMMNAFDLIRQAAIITNHLGGSPRFNRTAQILVGNDILMIHGRLRGITPPADRALRDLLLSIVSPDCAKHHDGIILRHRNGGLLIVQATILSPAVFGPSSILVTVNDPATRPKPVASLVAQAFDLTSAETKLANLLVNGGGLRVAAEKLGVSISTVRTHLKAIFGKTNTHSQAELVASLATFQSAL